MPISITKLVLRGDFNATDQTRNIFYLWNANGTILGDAGITDYITSMFDADVRAAISSSWHGRSVDAYLWNDAQQYWAFYSSVPFVTAGLDNSAMGGQQLAYVWVARTGVKRVVPKKFIAGATTACAPGGVLTAGTVTLMQTHADFWATTYNQAGEQFVPGTFMQNHAFTPILDVRVDSVVGTQRRRKQGVGF